MDQKIDNQFDVLSQALQSAGLAVSRLKGGLRVKTDSGISIDIYSLTGNPDQVRARVKLKEPDPLRRQAYVESVYNTLSAAMKGIAGAAPFYLSREAAGVHVYNAVIEIDAVPEDNPVFDSGRFMESLNARQ